MKKLQHITTKDSFDNRMSISNHQHRVPKPKLSTGSITGMYPVILDGGRTIIYITDKSKESETREKYDLRRGNKLIIDSGKPKT
jgi:hypothetical protein